MQEARGTPAGRCADQTEGRVEAGQGHGEPCPGYTSPHPGCDLPRLRVYTPCLFLTGSKPLFLMQQFLEFLLNHWILSGLWLGLFITLIVYLKMKAGSALSPHQVTLLVNRQDGVVLDIRDGKAFEAGHIVDAVNIPLGKLKERLKELEKYREKPLVVVCQMGHQSAEAVKLLEENGFATVSRMHGGMAEWQAQGLPAVK